jgi:hypothetical protein
MKTSTTLTGNWLTKIAMICLILISGREAFAQSYCSTVNGWGYNCCDIGISEVKITGLPSTNFTNSTGTPQYDGDTYEYNYTGSYSFSVVPCQTLTLQSPTPANTTSIPGPG